MEDRDYLLGCLGNMKSDAESVKEYAGLISDGKNREGDCARKALNACNGIGSICERIQMMALDGGTVLMEVETERERLQVAEYLIAAFESGLKAAKSMKKHVKQEE